MTIAVQVDDREEKEEEVEPSIGTLHHPLDPAVKNPSYPTIHHSATVAVQVDDREKEEEEVEPSIGTLHHPSDHAVKNPL